MSLILITEPADTPVSLDEVKSQLRLSNAAQDTFLSILLAAAVEQAQNQTKCQMVEAGYRLKRDFFPAGGIMELPRPPLQSVTSIKYIDTDGAEQTLSSSIYEVDTESKPGRVRLAYGQSWPSTRIQAQAVTVEYQTGWPISGSRPTTPDSIRLWILQRVTDAFMNRRPSASARGPWWLSCPGPTSTGFWTRSWCPMFRSNPC